MARRRTGRRSKALVAGMALAGLLPVLAQAQGAPSRRPDIQAELGYVYDDNVTRGRVSGDKRSDHQASLVLSTRKTWPLGSNTQATLSGTLGGEAFARHPKLGRVFGDVEASLDYRTSGAFDATTFGAFVRVGGDHYESRLRTGQRYGAGVTAQRALTDRISLFALVGYDERNAESAVFDGRAYGGRLNLDYAVGERGTLYLGADVRRGDTVSSGLSSLENIDTAKVLVRDTAFPADFFSYRFEATTLVTTLGYNLGLGSRASVDLSWRHARSKPTTSPPFATSVPNRYVANQVALSVLVRF